MPNDLDLRMMARCIELSRDSIAAGELPFGCVTNPTATISTAVRRMLIYLNTPLESVGRRLMVDFRTPAA